MRILCIIPVRGGSKQLPRKNCMEIIQGVSLLEWTIRQAHSVYDNEDVIVSTENKELSSIAQTTGARVIDRPDELAQDDTTTAAVVEHVLQQLDSDKKTYNAIAILQVTSALREKKDVEKSIQMITSGKYDSIISGFETINSHPAKQYTINKIKGMIVAEPILPDKHPLQQQHAYRQKRAKIYQRNGAIFLVTRKYFDKTKLLWGGRVGFVQMPFERSIDIDTEDDLKQARFFLNRKNN